MKLQILAVGRRMPDWVCAGFQDYARRMPRELPLLLREIRPEARGPGEPSAGETAALLRAEGVRVRAALARGGRVVVLDERGPALSSAQLAQRLARWMEEGSDVYFVIGGADGLEPAIKRSAQLLLSLSAMTLPHQLVRVLLAEQLYRAASLLRNHPYHRA